jgi:peptidoglycan/LPS O-acetylase OafA/YrhL
MRAAPAAVQAEPGAGARPARLRGLDGLRGLAALVVVVHHLLLVVPAISATVDVDGSGGTAPEPLSVPWWLSRTPLRVVWAGHEAVLLFFVLSGFVLTLPTLRGWSRAEWLGYYPRRLIRLYVPVWASVAVAVALAALVARDLSADSSWLAIHRPVSLRAVGLDSTLLLGTSNLNSPLWSLRWEMWFSLLLPAAVGLAAAARAARWWPAAVLLLAGLSAAADLPAVTSALPAPELTGGLLTYLPVFGIGVVLANVAPRLRALTVRLGRGTRRPAVWWVAATALSLLLAVGPTYVEGSEPVEWTLRTASVLGVVVMVVLTLGRPDAGSLLTRRPVQWLGSRSFSLYLVHEPLVVAAALLLGGPSPFLWALVALPLVVVVLLAAAVFHRLVERPAHRLSRMVGSHLGPRTSAAVGSAD